jgi:hypothetical protein
MVMSNYAWYNLSPQGKQSSLTIFKFLGLMVEGGIFCFLGLTFWSYRSNRWSTSLISSQLVIIIIGRAAGTLGVFYLSNALRKKQSSALSFNEVFYIFYSGLMRGSIAFGLVLKISDDFPDRDIIITTSLTLIVVTTLIFASTTGAVRRWLLDKQPINLDVSQSAMTNVSDEPLCGDLERDKPYSSSDLIFHYSNDTTHMTMTKSHELIVPLLAPPKQKSLGFADYMKRLDEYILRPLLIYKYEKGQLSKIR